MYFYDSKKNLASLDSVALIRRWNHFNGLRHVVLDLKKPKMLLGAGIACTVALLAAPAVIPCLIVVASLAAATALVGTAVYLAAERGLDNTSAVQKAQRENGEAEARRIADDASRASMAAMRAVFAQNAAAEAPPLPAPDAPPEAAPDVSREFHDGIARPVTMRALRFKGQAAPKALASRVQRGCRNV